MNPFRPFAALAALLLCAALPAPAFAQFGEEPQHAEAALYTRVEGREVRAAIWIRIDPGWHLYDADPGDAEGAEYSATTVVLGGEGIAWSEVRFPKPGTLFILDETYNVHEGVIVLYALGRMEAGATGDDVTAVISGITCSTSCVPYEETLESAGPGPPDLFENFPDDLAQGGETAKPPPEPKPPAPHAKPPDAADYDAVAFPDFQPQRRGETHWFGVWLLVAFVAGALLNVMPCVLPVVSIKVLSFVQQAGESRRRVLALGLAFAAGILVVFWLLAGGAVAFGLGWGEQFESPAFMVTLIAVVFAFALSLLDVFTFGVPRAVSDLAAARREGLADAFFKGMLATVMATPCSGPFLGGTLAWTLRQPALVIFLIFTMLGLGMGLPYVVLMSFPGLLKRMPKPGGWMVAFKHVMGFVLLATLVYLMLSLRSDLLLCANALLVFVAFGCWFWGRYAKPVQKPSRRLLVFAVSAAVVAGGAWVSFGPLQSLCAGGAAAGSVAGAGVPSGEAGGIWRDFDAALFERSLEEGRTVVVDFTANWCPNCKYNEKAVYDAAEIRALLEAKGAVALVADLTNASPRTDMLKRLRNKLGIYSIPLLAVFPGDRPLEPLLLPDIVTVDQVRKALEQCPDPE